MLGAIAERLGEDREKWAMAGLLQDLDSDESVFSLESSRRIGDNWKVSVDAFFVLNSSVEDPIHAFRDDDNIQIELMYYF